MLMPVEGARLSFVHLLGDYRLGMDSMRGGTFAISTDVRLPKQAACVGRGEGCVLFGSTESDDSWSGRKLFCHWTSLPYHPFIQSGCLRCSSIVREVWSASPPVSPTEDAKAALESQ